MRLPAISPPPDNAQPNLEFRKVLAAAQKLKKESGDAYLGVDTLLRALVETSKDLQEALNEAGTDFTVRSYMLILLADKRHHRKGSMCIHGHLSGHSLCHKR